MIHNGAHPLKLSLFMTVLMNDYLVTSINTIYTKQADLLNNVFFEEVIVYMTTLSDNTFVDCRLFQKSIHIYYWEYSTCCILNNKRN